MRHIPLSGLLLAWLLPLTGFAAEIVAAPRMLSSPNGEWHVYLREANSGTQIWIHDMLDSPHRALVSLPGNNGHMAWSPDSLFLAFCAEFKHRKFITVSDLTGHSWLVAEIDGDCNTPVWSPDATQLAFSAKTKNGDHDVFVATAGGTRHFNLTQSPEADESPEHWKTGETRPAIRLR